MELMRDFYQPGLYTCSLRVSMSSTQIRPNPAEPFRLLLIQPRKNGWAAGLLWSTMEGVRMVRLEVPDLGSFRALYGDCYRSTFTPIHAL